MNGSRRDGPVTVRFSVVCALLAAGVAGGCAAGGAGREGTQGMHNRPIEQVQQEHTDAWMAIPGVIGTGIGRSDDKPCILVFTASNTEQVRRAIPATVEGYPVVVRHSGEIRALDEPDK
jgi:hypothetical protein